MATQSDRAGIEDRIYDLAQAYPPYKLLGAAARCGGGAAQPKVGVDHVVVGFIYWRATLTECNPFF